MIFKFIIIYILSLCFVCHVHYAYAPACASYHDFLCHVLFPLSHANIFHLLCNMLAFAYIRGNLHFIPALIINFLASFLPVIYIYGDPALTCGFSGIIFAILGAKWGAYFYHTYIEHYDPTNLRTNLRRFSLYIILPIAISVLIPNINWSLHLYTLIMGIFYGVIYKLLKNG